MKKNVSTALLLTSLCIFIPSVSASLEGRLPQTACGDDYQAYYDTELDITWSRNVIYTGLDTWYEQTAWADSLTINDIRGWRLPDVDVNGDGVIVNCQYDSTEICTDNEIHYQLFRNGVTPSTPGDFTNFNQSGLYLASTELAPNPDFVWNISISTSRGIGGLGYFNKSVKGFAWAVRDGDIQSLSSSKMIENLIRKVVTLNMKNGISNSLDHKLNTARRVLDDVNTNNDNSAFNTLYAFIYAIDAQRGIHITNEQADDLINDTINIINGLSC